MGNKFLKKSEPVSDKTDIGVDVLFYVHPDSRRIETAWMFSPLGVDEWDFQEQSWVPLNGEENRGYTKWQKYAVYKLDWENKEANTLDLYKNRKLTEEHLKENAKLMHDEFGRSPKVND